MQMAVVALLPPAHNLHGIVLKCFMHMALISDKFLPGATVGFPPGTVWTLLAIWKRKQACKEVLQRSDSGSCWES
jgi:hypothetical protein